MKTFSLFFKGVNTAPYNNSNDNNKEGKHLRPCAKSANRSKSYNGYTLIEVLVSMFIIAFGMLGVAKLQLSSLQNVQSAHFSNQASFLTGKILAQIAANPQAILHYQLEITDKMVSPINCKTSNCGAALLAKFDLQQWQQQLANKLPSGKGEIHTTPNSAQIIIRWDNNRSGATGTQCPPVSASDLNCFKLNRLFH